jgi:N-acetylglucosamine-6-phosphate deacetylase
MKGFTNTNIYVEGKGIIKTSLEIENGKIKSIGKFKDGVELPDNLIVVPGFIDQHIHGANHSDSMYPTKKDILNIATSITQDGVTGFLPTTMTQSIENINKALENIKKYIEEGVEEGAEVLGIHLEGPFVSKKQKGAQPEEYILEASVDAFKKFQKVSGGNIKIVTLAYEENGKELTQYLKSKKIVASLGHTDATYAIASEAVKNGATSFTHCYNAMKGLHHRDAGTLGAAMLHDEAYVELICDLIHVSAPAIKILYKQKPKDKFILVTDSMEAKHLPDGKYQLGGQDVYVRDGAARLETGNLAGSVLKMNEAIRNCKETLEISLEEAIDFATINPARNLNISNKKGSIKVGKDADFAIIDQDLNVYETIRAGKTIYKKQ